MARLSTSACLQAWEEGTGRPSVSRARGVLRAACPERGDSDLSLLSVGARDALLLDVYRSSFAGTLNGVVSCSSCGERLECELDSVALADRAPSSPPAPISRGDYEIELELPTVGDFEDAAARSDLAVAEALLLERCVAAARFAGREIAPADLPPDLVAVIEERLAEADPLATLEIRLSCPECSESFGAAIDLERFLWVEVEARAVRLLDDVHELANAYGWSEREILALSPTRRRYYLERVRA